MELIYETESQLNLIRVFRDAEGVYYLRLGHGSEIHSMYDPKHILFTDAEEHYWNYFNLFPLMKKVKDVLLLGLGCGTVGLQFKHFFPQLSIDAVEIDKKIIDVARRYFDLDIMAMNIFNEDGTLFIKKGTKQYDLLIIDAFDGGNVATSFLKKEVFDDAKEKLKKNGLLALNYLDESPFTSIIKTRMLNHFNHVYNFSIEGTYNNIIFGCDEELNVDISVFETENRELRKVIKYFRDHVKKIK